MKKILFYYLIMLSHLVGCTPNENGDDHTQPVDDQVPFSTPEVAGTIQTSMIQEASGLVASRSMANVLWTHNDSGGEPKVYLISTTGTSLGSYWIQDAENRDWEDIAIGPGPDSNRDYIYVGDIGDNNARYEIKKIYRFPEPSAQPGQNEVDTVSDVHVISFIYPDGPRDAETILVDPFTRDIYVVSKRDTSVHLYRAAYPQDTENVNELELVGKLPLGSGSQADQIVAGDISKDGKEVLLKSYLKVYYWQRDDENTSLYDLLKSEPVELPYEAEPQGEAISFADDESGYYTLSEKSFASQQELFFYKRK